MDKIKSFNEYLNENSREGREDWEGLKYEVWHKVPTGYYIKGITRELIQPFSNIKYFDKYDEAVEYAQKKIQEYLNESEVNESNTYVKDPENNVVFELTPSEFKKYGTHDGKYKVVTKKDYDSWINSLKKDYIKESEVNEARKPGDPYAKMYDKLSSSLQLIQNTKNTLDDIRGIMNDTMSHAECKKSKAYGALIAFDKELGNIKDKLSSLDLEK